MDTLTAADITRLSDYFARELDENQSQVFERWVSESEARLQFIEDLRRSRQNDGSGLAIETTDVSARVQRLQSSFAKIRAEDRSSEPIASRVTVNDYQTGGTVSRPVKNFGAILCAFGMVAMLIVAGVYASLDRFGPVDRFGFHHTVTYQTRAGQRSIVQLADGSSIMLNVASQVDISTDYVEGRRTVRLNGAALFTVVSSPDAPFSVVAGPSVTRVLGTRFVVRHYSTDTAATVAVQDGKVSVGSTVLAARQGVVVGASGSSASLSTINNQVAFARNELVFDDVKLADAVPDLNRWYNADIRFADAQLQHRRLNGVFEGGSLTDLISILKLTFDLHVVRVGNVLTLHEKK